MTSPIYGATVRGSVTVTASATDNVGVTKVELYIDGKYFATDTTASYSFLWNTTKYSNANHTLMTKAYDAAGNAGSSSTNCYRQELNLARYFETRMLFSFW
ncbi:MAG: hypothetical protein DMG05_21995 [Acidobacteria bacterium]|nr:MAG: hypothetical protein DMG05_21995 [Acidobacteriota bacterium]